MRVFYCECGQKMKVSENMLGQTGKCVGCGRLITVTVSNTEAEGAPAPVSPGTPPPLPPNIGSDLSEAPEVEELLEPVGAMADAPPPPPPAPPLRPPAAFPTAPPLARGAAATQSTFGMDTILGALDLAFDLRKNTVAVGVGIVCAVGLAVLGYLAQAFLSEGGSMGAALMLAVLSLLWLWACLGMAMGGVARMVSLELDFKRRASIGQGSGFILQQLPGLAVVFVVFALVVSLAGGILWIVMAILLQIPGLGPIVAGLLTIPVFLIVLFLLCFLMQGGMAPSVMAVENCGATRAISRILALIPKAGGRILAYELMAFSVALPTLIIVFLIVSAGLFSATSMCSAGGAKTVGMLEQFLPGELTDAVGLFGESSRSGSRRDENFDFFRNPGLGGARQAVDAGPGAGVKVNGWLVRVSAGLVGTFFAAFLLVYFTTCLTIIYRVVRQNE